MQVTERDARASASPPAAPPIVSLAPSWAGGAVTEHVGLTSEQARLQADLVEALKVAVPEAGRLSQAQERADRAYCRVARVLVDLRHEFRSADGQLDLKGRSHEYRLAVRQAYMRAGAGGCGPIEKRLTAGVSYWVRKLLLERYGEATLYKLGIAKPTNIVDRTMNWKRWRLPEDPAERLPAVVGLLNELAADSEVTPTPELLHAMIRAVQLLRRRLA
jgi:hypothetical protein